MDNMLFASVIENATCRVITHIHIHTHTCTTYIHTYIHTYTHTYRKPFQPRDRWRYMTPRDFSFNSYNQKLVQQDMIYFSPTSQKSEKQNEPTTQSTSLSRNLLQDLLGLSFGLLYVTMFYSPNLTMMRHVVQIKSTPLSYLNYT